MRRLTLAAVSAALVLAACSDNTRESPTEPTAPTPEEHFGGRCRVVRFPLLQTLRQVKLVFPAGRLRLEAAVRAAAIALLWDTCKPALARRGVVLFMDFMNRSSASLIGNEAQRNELVRLLFTGVGLTAPPPLLLGPDFGIGFFNPGQTERTLIKTTGGTGLLELKPAGPGCAAPFDEFTIITMVRKSDAFRLSGFDGDQYPPFFDITASNASNEHVLAEGSCAALVLCFVLPNETDEYPDGARIGHNPEENAPGFPFELLEEIDLGPEGRADLAAELTCQNLDPNIEPEPIGMFGAPLPGFANTAWRMADRFLGPIARAILLPEPLRAATLGQRGPLGGVPPSISDFGIVVEVEQTTTTTLISSNQLAIVGAPLTLTATVSPAPPTVEEPVVEFFDGTTSLGSAFLNGSGVATLVTSSLSLDQHSLTAHFPGTATQSASTSTVLVQNTVQRFNDLTSFNAGLGGASTLTQDFEGFDPGTPISTVITDVLNVTSTFGSLQVFLSGGDKLLFGFDETTRQEGTGRYDLPFVAPLTNNAMAFNVEGKNPATAPATAIVTAGAGSASFSVQNASDSELTPAFVGFIASVPIVSLRFNEGPEIGGTGNEETALDDFIVAQVPLP